MGEIIDGGVRGQNGSDRLSSNGAGCRACPTRQAATTQGATATSASRPAQRYLPIVSYYY